MNTTTPITEQPTISASRTKKSTLKATLSMLALAVSLAAASQVQAVNFIYEGPSSALLDQNGPGYGPIGWSSVATFCQVLPNSAASSFNYSLGTVGFTATSSGTIGLACPMPGIMNGLTPAAINDFAVEFLNTAGQTGGCTISAYFVDRTTGLNSYWSSGQTSYGGQVWTANIGLSGNTYPLNPSHTYEIDIYLYRPAAAVGVCNPTLYSEFMEEVIQ